MVSANDIGNPIYDKAFEPRFQIEHITDYILDDDQREFKCEIEYHYYRYDGVSRIVVLVIRPKGENRMTNMSLIESVKEAIQLTERSFSVECTPEIKPFEYDGECVPSEWWSGGIADNH